MYKIHLHSEKNIEKAVSLQSHLTSHKYPGLVFMNNKLIKFAA